MNSPDPYKSKVAVITGGSRGIGYHVASALIDRGTKVVIGNRNNEEGQKIVKEFNERIGSEVAVFLATDVTKYDDLKALFGLAEKLFGGIDIAIMNAGTVGNNNILGAFSPLDDKNDMLIQEINVGGVIKGNKIALLYMAKQGKGGVIINTSSTSGLRSSRNLCHYNASKFAVNGWTRGLSKDLKSSLNIRVNAVCPTYVETDILHNLPNDPSSRKLVELSAKASMKNCVSAFLRIIEDSKINGETVCVWPDPIGVRIEPGFEKPESSISRELAEFAPEFEKIQDKLNKEKVIEAIKRAGI
ncbi:hypothetical protein BDC45DRAFT_521473 [Circinella umbellata]|nr:hypothetical protein BDC45DRAFT_521473 [Circinella umbellata]